jgi:hypothetical protein
MLGFSNIGRAPEMNSIPTPIKVSNDPKYIGDFDPDPGHELFPGGCIVGQASWPVIC